MPYRHYVESSCYGRDYGYEDGYRNTYDDHSTRYNSQSHQYQEPHVFLDLRDYYSCSANTNSISSHSYRRENYHSGQSYFRGSDYINEPSASRFEQSRSDYISQTPVSRRYQTPSPAPERYANRGYGGVNIDDTSAPYKSDYKIVKDGWGDRKNFMENHGLRLHNSDDYDTAHQILDGYRRIDAQSASQQTYDSDVDSNRGEQYNSDRGRRDGRDVYRSDFIGDYDDEERIEIDGQTFSSDCRGSFDTYGGYGESYVSGSDRRQEYSDDQERPDGSSDYDSTDAIDYYSDSNGNEDGMDDDDDDDNVVGEESDDYNDDDYY